MKEFTFLLAGILFVAVMQIQRRGAEEAETTARMARR